MNACSRRASTAASSTTSASTAGNARGREIRTPLLRVLRAPLERSGGLAGTHGRAVPGARLFQRPGTRARIAGAAAPVARLRAFPGSRGDTALMMQEANERGLLVDERRRRICELLRERGKVTVDALAVRFGTSQVTVRADLSVLESTGALTRTHGGALPREEAADQPLDVKQLQHHAE